MWLEGAVHSDWSVAQMRRQRWEAIGAPAELRPREEDVVAGDWDEDIPAALAERISAEPDTLDSPGEPPDDGADDDESQFDDATDQDSGETAADEGEASADGLAAVTPAPRRLFENLPVLPDDLAEACDQLRLAVVRHKLSGWQEAAQDDVLAWLDALRELAAEAT
jgi:hypothetical protein